MQLPPFSITPTHQHWSCVLDPALALSPYGVTLAKQLGEVMELWVVRELWHILDSADFYLQRPELVVSRRMTSARTPDRDRTNLEDVFWSLKEWERLRMETDLAGLNLFWFGDSLRESFLPKGRNSEIFWRWESLARSLDNQLEQSQTANDILTSAFRDAAALSASLGSAFILTYQLPTDLGNNLPPDICKALENWGIPCQSLRPQEPTVIEERDYLRQLIIHAGLAKLLWAGLNLAVLHLVVPAASALHVGPERLQTTQIARVEDSVEDSELKNHLWAGTRGFWYQL